MQETCAHISGILFLAPPLETVVGWIAVHAEESIYLCHRFRCRISSTDVDNAAQSLRAEQSRRSAFQHLDLRNVLGGDIVPLCIGDVGRHKRHFVHQNHHAAACAVAPARAGTDTRLVVVDIDARNLVERRFYIIGILVFYHLRLQHFH